MLTWQNTGDPCTPDTFTFVNHLFPTRIGYTNGLEPTLFNTLGAPTATVASDTNYYPRGIAFFNTSGAQHFYFALANKIWDFAGGGGGGTVTDISNASAPTGYTFSFAQYRDAVYACNGADLLQKSTGSNFANVATTPKLTRIATNGDYLAGINNVASFGTTPIAASNNRVWVSAVGNPEQFDPAIDSTAYTQEIRDDGGPLVAIARLRDFFVLIKKSGVYVMQYTGTAPYLWNIQPVSAYFGCEWPDSVIEVNNILYWISPTRGGEVVAFDGSQITVVSSQTKKTYLDSRNDYEQGFFNGIVVGNFTGITAATDGESITWNALSSTNITSATYTYQFYLNIPTGRTGYSDRLISTNAFMLLASNALQSGYLAVYPKTIATGANVFYVGQAKPGSTYAGRAEFYRGNGKDIVTLKNLALRFSEYADNKFIYDQLNTTFPFGTSSGTIGYLGTPTLKIASSKNSGDAANKTEGLTPISPITATWNATTQSFDISQNGNRSTSAATFAFILEINPNYWSSLIGLTISGDQAGTKQAGAKAVQWQ